jgi:bacterioferritin
MFSNHFSTSQTVLKENIMNKDEVLKIHNLIMELELAGVMSYTHYALMVYGYNRTPLSLTGCKKIQPAANSGLLHI